MGRVTVLVVEDNQDHALLLRLALESQRTDVQVRMALSTAQARAYLAGDGPYEDREAYPLPDVVSLDVMLGDGSGFEILRWMSLRPHLEQVPVLFLTSAPVAEDRERALRMGALQYLVKPSDFRGVLPHFERAIEEAARRAAERKSEPRRHA